MSTQNKPTKSRKRIADEIMKQIGKSVILVFLLVAIVAIVMVGWTIMTSKETELTLESSAAAKQLTGFLEQYIRSAEQLAVNPEIKDVMLQTGAGDDILQADNMDTVRENLISIFIVFALLYWVGMARMVRSQVLMLKESEYVTAARALGVGNGKIIKKHLLTNCIGTLIVTTTLQIPSSIFTESFLSFLGLGVAVPLPSLGSLASEAINGLNTYPYLLFIPAALISLIILSFNLLGDGLRDAFDPKLKN